MYQVLLGDLNGAYQTIYYPADEKCAIFDAKLNLQIGNAGVFEFKVPVQNPCYSSIGQSSIISIIRDDEEFWRGYVTEISTDFNKIMSVYCVEDLMWLNEEYSYYPFRRTEYTNSYNFNNLISKYNESHASDGRTFNTGIITNVNGSDVAVWLNTYEMTNLSCIRENLCKDTGFLKVRRVTANGTVTRYIDCLRLQDYGQISGQVIEFAENLLNYAEEIDGSNIVNVVYPVGAETDEEWYEGQRKRSHGNTISNPDSIAMYGRRERLVIFETDNLNTLNSLASAYLTRYSQPQIKLNLTAIDLADLGQSNAHYNIGDQIHVIAEPFGIDRWIYVTEQDIDLQNPADNKIVLADNVRVGSQSLTQQSIDTQEMMKEIPSKSSIVDAARLDAMKLLQGADGGHVSFGMDEDGNIDELRIANAEDIEQATKKWIWNVNGLGYMERASSNDDWSTPRIAATMNGSIVADSITSGTLTLGNGGNDAPLLQAYSGNNLVARINRNGLYAVAGEIAGYTINGANGLLYNKTDRYSEYSVNKMHIGGKWGNYWTFCGISNLGEFFHCDYGGSAAGGLWVTGNGANDMYNFSGGAMHITKQSISCDAHGEVQWSGSDKRIKRDIEDLSLEESKQLIENVRPRKFQMLAEDGTRYGFIAQEVRNILPSDSGIEFGTEEMRNINYNDFIAPLTMCINDLYAQIDDLKRELNKYKEVE